jgi:uncharacterized protein YcaQ
MLTIDLETAHRFILGKQGLWPGRRSHDITLHSRVLEYTPGLWEALAYQQRTFFDWGGWLAVRPMDELPHWRVVMRRERDGGSRMRGMARDHAAAIAEMRAVLRGRGTVSNRDFAMATRTRTQSYRGRTDSALALYYLWRAGEVMTHHRENFERVYALAESVAPAHLLCESDEAEAARFLIKKDVSFSGLARMGRTSDTFHSSVPFDNAKQLLEAMLADGELIAVQVEGWKAVHFALGSDAEALVELSAGRVPPAWTPLQTSTTDEVVFLAPLDPVSARGRAKGVFGFDYVWYCLGGLQARAPAHVRVLYGAHLVGQSARRAFRQQARPDDQHVCHPGIVVRR